MAITALPTAPSRADPNNFADQADAFMAALPTFATECNSTASTINGQAATVAASETICTGAANYQGVYSAGTTYAVGESVTYNDKQYVSNVNSNLGNTPSSSPTQWEQIDRSFENHLTVTSTTNSVTMDCSLANSFKHVLTENTTATFSNPPASGLAYGMTLQIVQDASASGYTFTWPATIVWHGGSAPTLSTGANAVDMFTVFTNDAGTTWFGFLAGKGMA